MATPQNSLHAENRLCAFASAATSPRQASNGQITPGFAILTRISECSRLTAHGLRGRYVTALIVQWQIPHRRIREDGHLQPHIPRHQQGRVFIPFPWMSRYSECPWRCGNRGLDTLPSCPIAALGLPEGSLHGCTSTKMGE